MATEEDFSFPTIPNTPPRFLESPPLWPLCHEISDQTENNQLKSFLYTEDDDSHEEEEEEKEEEEKEKMDLLWEDFNEEFSKTCGSKLEYSDDMSPERVVDNFGCVQALKLSKTGISGRRPSVVVFIKVLKNLFLLHNSHRTLKTRSW